MFAPEVSLVPVPDKPDWVYGLCFQCYEQSRAAGRSPFRGGHIAGGRVRRISPDQRWRPRGRPEAPLSETERSLLGRAHRFDDGVGPEPTQLRAIAKERDEHGRRWLVLT